MDIVKKVTLYMNDPEANAGLMDEYFEFKIGELANSSGVSVQTIRMYEQMGLIPKPPRKKLGHRYYNRGYVRRLEFIGMLKECSFSLDEIKEVLELMMATKRLSLVKKKRLKSLLIRIEARVKNLNKLKRQLNRILEL